MNICMLTTDYLPNIGGIAAHVHNLSVALAELGHKVAIVNPVARDNEQIDVTRANGLVIYRVGINSAKPAFRNKMLRKRMFSKAAQRGIDAAQVDLGRFDVVHQHDYQDTTY